MADAAAVELCDGRAPSATLAWPTREPTPLSLLRFFAPLGAHGDARVSEPPPSPLARFACVTHRVATGPRHEPNDDRAHHTRRCAAPSSST